MKRIAIIVLFRAAALALLPVAALPQHRCAAQQPVESDQQRLERVMRDKPEEADWHWAVAELKRRPESLTAKLTRVIYLGQNERVPEAIREADAAIEQHPQAAIAFGVRAELNRSRREFDQAGRDLERAHALDPRDPWVRFFHTMLLSDQGNVSQEISELEQLIVDSGDKVPNARRKLAATLLQVGQIEEGRRQAALCVKERPQDGKSYKVLAVAELAADNRLAALDAANQSVALAPADFATWRFRGSVRELLQDFNAANRDYRSAIETAKFDRQKAAIYCDMAMMDYEREKFDSVLTNISEAVRLDPANVHYLRERANVYFKLRRFNEARADLARAIADATSGAGKLTSDLTLPQLFRSRATINLFLGDHAAYETDRAEADRLENEEASKEAGKPRQIGDQSKVAADDDPPIEVVSQENDAVEAIDALLNRGANAEARQQSDEALREFPKSNDLIRRRGWANFELGNYQAAFDDFDHALRLDPRSALALKGRSQCHALLGRRTEAYADLTQAIEIDPTCSEYWCMRSSVAPNVKAAFTDLAKAVELDPSDAKPYLDRGCSLLGQQQYDLAAVELKRALAHWPKNARKGAISFAYAQLATALAETGSPQAEVEDLFRKAIEDDPDHPIVLWLRSNYFRRQGRTAEALADLDRIVPEVQVQMPVVEVARAELLRDLGKLDEALQLANQKLDEGPQFRARLLRLRATIYAAQQRWQEYESDLALAIALEEPKADSAPLHKEARKP